jgi:hypothetical protein
LALDSFSINFLPRDIVIFDMFLICSIISFAYCTWAQTTEVENLALR